MTLEKFVKARKFLFWSVDPEKLHLINPEAIVETILNYGDWDDVQLMIKILGIKRVAKIFRQQISNWRTNYDEKIIYYFKRYFNKYA